MPAQLLRSLVRGRGTAVVEAHGVAIFWKIDLYDTAYTYGAENPSDPEQTRRVLTLYLPSEH